ncbi:hypothetical protein HQ47_08360 [Porphyromonas macacae]|uniref:Uncharacterized protein n=1 Tax=Porphyromonas macacae TaxID=28115 RepID=A0A0A2EAJ5_9PORP|nr:hypothetical protein HQ47_08360 [Porphyromonas macacae]SUB88139.1 Uncharacterised protein [Porphyromonas macacae]
MKRLIDYIIYRLYHVYLHKEPAPEAGAQTLASLAIGSFIYFSCTFTLKVIFNISIRDIYPKNSRLFLGVYISGIIGIVYWWVKKRYTEKYITTTLASKFKGSKYNKMIKGWMIIIACLLCFFACGILASMIDWFFRR